jgi:YaiO family outer membrane protein
MRNWSKELYTMSTLGGTIDEPVFPRFQIEQEFNYIVPQHPVLVLAFGAGDRYYPSQNRPYLVFGGSYGLPKAGFSYRYWVGRGIAEKASSTHLLTWIYGDRLDFWLRLDLLWGDETHNVGLVHDAEVDSRGITLTVEKWLSRSFGFITTAEFTEMTLEIEEPIVLHRVQLGARAFITF